MGVDTFICGECQKVFHTIDKFVEHKNVGCQAPGVSTTPATSAQVPPVDSLTIEGYQVSVPTIVSNNAVQHLTVKDEAAQEQTQNELSDIPGSSVSSSVVSIQNDQAVITQPLQQLPLPTCAGEGLAQQLVQVQDGAEMVQHLQVQDSSNGQLVQIEYEQLRNLSQEALLSQPSESAVSTQIGVSADQQVAAVGEIQSISTDGTIIQADELGTDSTIVSSNMLQDLIEALQQGRAVAVQNDTGVPTEIQLVQVGHESVDAALPSTSDTSTAVDFGVQTEAPSGPNTPTKDRHLVKPLGTTMIGVLDCEGTVSRKPARKRGRPRKGEEKNAPKGTTEPAVEQTRPESQMGADGRLQCKRCKKSFGRERHFNTHKCMASSDYVDALGKELNLEEDGDSSDDDEQKDSDFRLTYIPKRPRLSRGARRGRYAHVLIKQAVPEDIVTLEEKQPPETEEVLVLHSQALDAGEAKIMESLDPLTGDVATGDHGQPQATVGLVGDPNGPTLSQVNDLEQSQPVMPQVDEGPLDPPGQTPVDIPPPQEEDLNMDVIEKVRTRTVRKKKNAVIITDSTTTTVPGKRIKDLPIFTTEEDKQAFEKCINVDLNGMVENLFKEHSIDQDLNEYAPFQRASRLSDKLKVFSCSVCEKVLMSLSQARLHCVIHTEFRPFKCFKCDYATNTKGNLYTHMRHHTGQLYKCAECSFSAVNKSHLVDHMATHTNHRHQCKLCRRDYSTLKSLVNHVRRQHNKSQVGRDYLEEFQGKHNRGPAVLHQCHVCNRKFKKKMDRDRHMFIHDIKDNPNVFECELCDYVCSRRCYLKKHWSRHRIVYMCCECLMKFPSSTRLTAHLLETHFNGRVTDDVLRHMFETSVTKSVYLPEPDGSIVNLGKEIEQEESRDIKPSSSDQYSETSGENKENKSESSQNDGTGQNVKNESTGLTSQDQNLTKDDQENVPQTGDAGPDPELNDMPVDSEDPDDPEEDLLQVMGYKPMDMNVFHKLRQFFGKEECDFCGRLFFSASDFDNHLRTHTGERPFGCNQCTYKATSKENLKRHIEKEHSKLRYICQDCGFEANNRSHLWTHSQTHKSPVSFPCHKCDGILFESVKQLKVHIQMKHPDMSADDVRQATTVVQHKARPKIGRKSYKCTYCDRGFFRTSADLQKHIWMHEGIKPFKCVLCPHACRSRNNLASHMLRHSMEKPFLCTECGKAYKSKTALRWHVRSHKHGKFKCNKCSYEATQISHLKRHLETHNIIKRFVCQHCSYSANTLGYLKIHYTRHHKGQQCTPRVVTTADPSIVGHVATQSQSKVYRCLSCDYLFGNLSDMKRHLRLRHHIQTEHMNLLDDLNTMPASMPDGAQVLQLGSSTDDTHAELVLAGTSEERDASSALQALQYHEYGISVPTEVEASTDDEKAAASILQQFIDMSQVPVAGQQEVTVKSEDGQAFIVQGGEEVVVASGATDDVANRQYVIQYVMPQDAQEVTVDQATGQEVVMTSTPQDGFVGEGQVMIMSEGHELMSVDSGTQQEIITQNHVQGHEVIMTQQGQGHEVIMTQQGQGHEVIMTQQGQGHEVIMTQQGQGHEVIMAYDGQIMDKDGMLSQDPLGQNQEVVLKSEGQGHSQLGQEVILAYVGQAQGQPLSSEETSELNLIAQQSEGDEMIATQQQITVNNDILPEQNVEVIQTNINDSVSFDNGSMTEAPAGETEQPAVVTQTLTEGEQLQMY